MTDSKSGSDTTPALGNRLPDYLASLIRSVAGAVPLAGPAISELLSGIIPNQRADRIEKFVVHLAQELSCMDEKFWRAVFQDPYNVALFEEGAYSAVKAIHEDRLRHLSLLVAKGISRDENAKLDFLRIIRLLSELDDAEVVMLASFERDPKTAIENTAPTRPKFATTQDALDRWALYNYSLLKFDRLGLLMLGQDMQKMTGLEHSEIAEILGIRAAGERTITPLGKLLLEAIEPM